jgi:predicted NBD/HSP70 family sugar kinase
VPSSYLSVSKPSAAVAPSLLRAMNQRYLLDWLYTNGPATRPQLAKESGLSQPTVFATLSDLEQAGLVRPLGETDRASGRPALIYEADPSARAVAAIEIAVDWVRIVVADLAGTELAKTEVRNTARSVASLVRIVHNALASVTTGPGLRLPDVIHTIVASPGPQFMGDAYAAQFRGWQRPKLAEALREGLGTSLTLENNVNLAALGEYTEGAGENRFSPFVYLLIDTGVGLGLIVDGQLYRGATGAEGEVGFLPVPGAGNDPAARVPGRTLEESLAAQAVVDYGRAAGMTGSLSAEMVFEAARKGSPEALLAVDRESDAIAYLLAGVCAFLDPEIIVMGGEVGRNLDLLRPRILERLAAMTPFKARLVASQLGQAATARGALVRGVSLAREEVFVSRINNRSA